MEKKAFYPKWVDPGAIWDGYGSNSGFRDAYRTFQKTKWPIQHLFGFVNGTTDQGHLYENLWCEFEPKMNVSNFNLKIKRYKSGPKENKLTTIPARNAQYISADYCVVLIALLGQAEKGGSQFGTQATGKSQSTHSLMNLNE